MNNARPRDLKAGNVVLIVLAAIAVLGVVGILAMKGTEPTDEPRLNPEPLSGYALEVSEVKPGNTIMISAVTLESKASIVVVKDVTAQTEIGKSLVLDAGDHTNVEIKLSSPVKDGDVIYIRLKDVDGEFVQSNGVNIEVMKSIGDTMIHYDNEY